MPYTKRRTYRRRRTYKRKGKRTRYTMKRRRTYRKSVDKGTFLKISSSSLPVVINNKASPGQGLTLTDDTFQSRLRFFIGDTASAETVIINNEYDTSGSIPLITVNDVYIGSDDLLSKYTGMYKYMQVMKIVVKFTPTITEGGVLSTSPGTYITNAISGNMCTDIDSNDIAFPYSVDYPPSVDGNAKSMSRKVSRIHKLTKAWTRTFVPKNQIQTIIANPKAKYQYKPELDLTTREIETELPLGQSQFHMRMRKPQLAGYTAASLDLIETEWPDLGTFVRFGTLQCHAYVKFRSPVF